MPLLAWLLGLLWLFQGMDVSFVWENVNSRNYRRRSHSCTGSAPRFSMLGAEGSECLRPSAELKRNLEAEALKIRERSWEAKGFELALCKAFPSSPKDGKEDA